MDHSHMFIIYKRLRAVSREGKRDEGAKKVVVDFYDRIIGKAKGFKGLIMTGNLDDPQKAVNLSLWKSR
ncbi:MAG: hypothetical protein ACJ71O_06900 [Nitrososphaeraceae archaeon]